MVSRRPFVRRGSAQGALWVTLMSVCLWSCETKSSTAPIPSGVKPSDGESQTLTLWHALRDRERDHLLSDLKDFKHETGVHVRALELPHKAFANKLQVSIPRGNGPDLMIGAHDRIGDWAEAGLIEPLGFWMRSGELDSFLTPAIEAFTYRYQLYGLPLSCKALALFYHPALVGAPPQSTDELFTAARAVKSDQVWGLAYPELDSLYFHGPWLHAHGGRVISSSGPTLNSEAMRASIQLVRGLRDEGLIPPEVNGALASELFRTKRLAFMINGPWFVAELKSAQAKEEKDQVEWAVAPLPILSSTGRSLAPYLSVEGVMISSRARHPKLALKLARFLASPDRATQRFRRGELVAHRALNAQALSEAPSWLRVFHSQVGSSVPLSNDPLMKSLWTPSQRALAQSIIYQGDLNEALEGAQRDVLKSIKISGAPLPSQRQEPQADEVTHE